VNLWIISVKKGIPPASSPANFLTLSHPLFCFCCSTKLSSEIPPLPPTLCCLCSKLCGRIQDLPDSPTWLTQRRTRVISTNDIPLNRRSRPNYDPGSKERGVTSRERRDLFAIEGPDEVRPWKVYLLSNNLGRKKRESWDVEPNRDALATIEDSLLPSTTTPEKRERER